MERSWCESHCEECKEERDPPTLDKEKAQTDRVRHDALPAARAGNVCACFPAHRKDCNGPGSSLVPPL